MTAWTYHTDTFPDHVRRFFESLHMGPRVQGGGDGIVRDPQFSFHIDDLTLSTKRPDHLEHISQNELQLFAASLTYVVLINQVVHAHFPHIHDEFWSRTRYPLVAGGLNPSRSPYDIISSDAWTNRGVATEDIESAWCDMVAHLSEDLQSLESDDLKDLGISVSAFKKAALDDSDVVEPSPWGPKVVQALR
jgi:hypothetical protein